MSSTEPVDLERYFTTTELSDEVVVDPVFKLLVDVVRRSSSNL
jgi:hypothetical protein